MTVIDIVKIGSYVTAPGTTYDRPTTGDFSEILWFTEGTSRLVFGSDTHTLPPSTVVLTPPGQQYMYFWDPDRVTRMGSIVFTTTGNEWPLVRSLAMDDVILALLNHVVWLNSVRPTGWNDQVPEAFAYALHAYRTGASATSSLNDSGLPLPIERSMTLVRARWSPGAPFRTPSLDELADAAAVTPEHLCRVYKKELGYSPMAALRLLRLRYTASLLVRTDLTVGKVAHQGGFESQFHFTRSFKQTFGMSPTSFRQTKQPIPIPPHAIQRLGLYL